MNTKMATKINLLNYIKSFSMPDFPNLKIFSKTFFSDIFLHYNMRHDKYSLLYGDIDGLRKLNDTIGFDNADIAMENLLKTVISYLPDNTISFRTGGDEFCFVIPRLNTEETRKITKQIHSSLKKDEKVNGLDITFGSCDSSKFSSLEALYKYAENKVNLKKNLGLKLNENIHNIDDYKIKLDAFIDSTVKNYINHFRFSSNRVFTREDLEALSYPLLDRISNLMNSKNINNFHNSNYIESSGLNLDDETTRKIYKLIIDSNIDYESLDSLSVKDLKSVRDDLSTDSITNAHNNVYRDHYLLPNFEEEETPYKLILVQSIGIKILNSIESHTGTDKKIKKTFDAMMKQFKQNIPENSTIKFYPIHSGGGTFELLVLDDNLDIINKTLVDDILNRVNSNEETIKLIGTVDNNDSSIDYTKLHSDMDKACDLKKDVLKGSSDYFITDNALKLMDVSLSSVVEFFKTQSKKFGIYNETEKENFYRKFVNSLIDNFYALNISNKKQEKTDDYTK